MGRRHACPCLSGIVKRCGCVTPFFPSVGRYGKHLGDQWDTGRGKMPAETKCDVEKDAGYTKADKIDSKNKYAHTRTERLCTAWFTDTSIHTVPLRVSSPLPPAD